MQFDDDYDDDDYKVDDVPMFDYNVDSSEQMDEHMAALVLTSLSCSPASPAYMPGAARFEPTGTLTEWLPCHVALVTGQLADTPTRRLPTRGLDVSRTGQFAD